MVELKYDANGNVLDRIAYARTIPAATAATEVAIGSAIAAIRNPVLDRHAYAVYDAANRRTWSIDGAGGVAKVVYDADGNVVEQRTYVNRIDTSSWTLGTAPAVVADDTRDQRVQSVYDRANRARFTISGTGGVVEQKYDRNGNVTEQISYATTISTATPATESDVSGAVVKSAARDQHVYHGYDAAGRRTWTVDGVGGTTTRAYDANGNLIEERVYAAKLNLSTWTPGTTPTVTGTAANPNLLVRNVYDKANRVRFTMNGVGAVVEQTYDGVGHVLERVAYATVVPTSTAMNEVDSQDRRQRGEERREGLPRPVALRRRWARGLDGQRRRRGHPADLRRRRAAGEAGGLRHGRREHGRAERGGCHGRRPGHAVRVRQGWSPGLHGERAGRREPDRLRRHRQRHPAHRLRRYHRGADRGHGSGGRRGRREPGAGRER
ncbi:MAG: hypothetical protein QM767_02960 [Anaeromyxobacter sp.]